MAKKAADLLRKLLLRGRERLLNLFRGSRSRSEVVATFLAVLELCKNGNITLTGDKTDEITINLVNDNYEAGEEDE